MFSRTVVVLPSTIRVINVSFLTIMFVYIYIDVVVRASDTSLVANCLQAVGHWTTKTPQLAILLVHLASN